MFIIYTNLIIFRSFAIIPPKSLPKLSEIIKIVCENGLSISNCAMYELSRQQSSDLIDKLALGISDIFSSGPTVALVLVGCNTFNRLNQLISGRLFFDVLLLFIFKKYFLFKSNRINQIPYCNRLLFLNLQAQKKK